MIAYIDTLAFKKFEQGQPKRHRRLASLPKQCPTRSPASSRRRARATRRRCGVDHQLQPQHPSSSSSDDEEIEATPFFKPKPRAPTKKAEAPARSAEEPPRATTPSTRPPRKKPQERSWLKMPWLVPGKVVKPPHLDENAPPTPPFTVPKPRLLVPPRGRGGGLRVAGGLLWDGQGPAARGAFT